MYPSGYPQFPSQPPFPKPVAPMPPMYADDSYNLDARLDRIEREIIEINRRLNTLSRHVRRIENYLNIREDFS
ncbi:MAG: hypothetical protein GX490_04830 [Bacilli bacterium]|nr:hypothetical protein [Bacilli bacterium]